MAMAAVHPNCPLPSSPVGPAGDGPIAFSAHAAGHNDVTSSMMTGTSSPGSAASAAPTIPPEDGADRSSSQQDGPAAAAAAASDDTTEVQFGTALFGRKPHLDDFVRVRTLGTGTFARVVLVRRREPRSEAEAREVFALKILRKAVVIKLKQIDHVRHERRILQEVSGHPFITNLQASFADHDFLYLLLDYVPGGELFSYLRRYGRFEEPMARFYAAEIVLVLEYLHERQDGVAYRDLKPENLLLDDRGHVKLVDFGFAKRLGRRSPEGAVETYTLCGTPEYIAPEVIQNMGHTTAVDWWALGILVYEFLTGYPPFWNQNPLEIYRQILEQPVVFPRDPPISPAAQDFIRQLCTVDRSRRLGNISGGAAKVKSHVFFDGIDWDALNARRDEGPIVPSVRFVGDAHCFDIYPENDVDYARYTDDLADQYDTCFSEF